MNTVTEIEIAGLRIGAARPPFIIAEMSANHKGDIGRALALMLAAKEAGADAVKLRSMADLGEIPETVTVARDAGACDIALSHCTSIYHAPVADQHLRTIPDLAQTVDVVRGLPDHSLGTAVAVALVVLGPAAIEMHLTLSRSDGGPDAAFSLEPDEFAQLAHDVRSARDALRIVNCERKPNLTLQQSLYVVQDVTEGEQLTSINVRAIRPGHGLAPKCLEQVIGRRARTRLIKGTALHWDLLV